MCFFAKKMWCEYAKKSWGFFFSLIFVKKMETINDLKDLRKCISQGQNIIDPEYYHDILEKTHRLGLVFKKGHYSLRRANGSKVPKPYQELTRLIEDLRSIKKYKSIVHENLLQACKNKNFHCIQTIFDLCNDEDLYELITTIGSDYQLPLRLLCDFPSSKTSSNCTESCSLEKISNRITILLDKCSASEPITSLVTIKSKKHPKLMKLACHLINATRKMIINSWNHPSHNGLDKADLQKMKDQRIENISKGTIARDKVLFKANLDKEIITVVSKQNKKDGTTTFHVVLSTHLRNAMIDAYLKPAIETNTGNCLECALVALRMVKNIPGEVMYLNRGDHAVLILKNKIIVDPWYGAVYSKHECADKMMTYIEATSANGKVANICTNAQINKLDTLEFYCLSKSGTFYITCDTNSKEFVILSNKLK